MIPTLWAFSHDPANFTAHAENHRRKIITTLNRGVYGLALREAFCFKGALQIISEALRMEVAQFGIEVCTLAPGDYATDIASRRYYQPNKKGSPYEKHQES